MPFLVRAASFDEGKSFALMIKACAASREAREDDRIKEKFFPFLVRVRAAQHE